MEVINDDYADFVSLSTKLVNVDGAVLRMQRPLTEVQERLAGVEHTLQVAAGPLIDVEVLHSVLNRHFIPNCFRRKPHLLQLTMILLAFGYLYILCLSSG